MAKPCSGMNEDVDSAYRKRQSQLPTPFLQPEVCTLQRLPHLDYLNLSPCSVVSGMLQLPPENQVRPSPTSPYVSMSISCSFPCCPSQACLGATLDEEAACQVCALRHEYSGNLRVSRRLRRGEHLSWLDDIALVWVP